MTPTQAWLVLLALSAGSTLAAGSGLAGPMLALIVLALAWAKARVILGAYLGLQEAPRWQRGFDLGLALLLITMAVLAVA
jgi:hypothetical protein